jgi:hypothetical protein
VWFLAVGCTSINPRMPNGVNLITFDIINTKKSFSRISQASMVLSSCKTLPERDGVSNRMWIKRFYRFEPE